MKLLENEKFVFPIITVLTTILVYIILKNIIQRIFDLQVKNKHLNTRKLKTIKILVLNILKCLLIVIDIIVILGIFGIKTTTLLASLGAIGVVVGLAFQDILKDLLAGIFIIIENQFTIGDVIETNGFKGEVVEIGLKTTRIKAYTGEIAIIANRNIDKTINYNLSESRAIVSVGVDYDEDIDKVLNVLNNLSDKIGTDIKGITKKIEVLGVEALGDSAIVVKVSVLTKPMQHYAVQRELNKIILNELKKNSIKIPFPQVEVHNGTKL